MKDYSSIFQFIGDLASIPGMILIFGALAAAVGVGFFIKYFSSQLLYKRNKMKYLIKKGNTSYLRLFTKALMKNKKMEKLIRAVALKIGMVSKYTYEKNQEIAVASMIVAMLFSILIIVLFVPMTDIMWYEIVFYLIIAALLIAILFYVAFSMVRTSFIGKLPDVYKILNSRYISKGNILKAIDISLDDFDRVIRKEMMKIYNILKKNDMAEINDAFKEIEKTYNTEYLTILLSLIKQAHFKGGNDMIKEQFETITEEILQEIENQNDLTSASRSYIVMSIFIAPIMKFVETFNEDAIGDKAAEFYTGQTGRSLFLLTLGLMFAYIGMMLFLERSA